MPIYQLDPDAAKRQQYNMVMQMLVNAAMQRTQLEARKKEAEVQRTWLEGQQVKEQTFNERIQLLHGLQTGTLRPTKAGGQQQVTMAGTRTPLAPTGEVTVSERPETPDMILAGQPVKAVPQRKYKQYVEMRGGKLYVRSVPETEPAEGGLPVGEGATAAILKSILGDDTDWTKPDAPPALDLFLSQKSPYDVTTKKGLQASMAWFKTKEAQESWTPFLDDYLRKTAPVTYIGSSPEGAVVLGGRTTTPTVSTVATPSGTTPGPKTTQRLPAEQRQSMTRFQTLHKTTYEIEKMVKDVEGKFTGPIQGRYQNFISWFVKTPEFTRLKNKLAQLRTIVYAESGKQINVNEIKWLDKEVLPKLYQPDENFLQTLGVFREWVESKHNDLFDAFTEQGYIVGGGKIKQNLDSYYR